MNNYQLKKVIQTMDIIKNYQPKNQQEVKDKQAMLDFLAHNPDAFDRRNLVAHFTSSAIIINKKMDKVLFIHHNEKYDGKYPFWVMIEFYDFGDMSKLYSQLTTELQKTVAKDLNQNYSIVASWLYCLTHLRNSCAHYSRLYNTSMIPIPKTPLNYPTKLNKSIFSYLLILKELTVSLVDWNDFRDKLKLLIDDFAENIDISRLGFPLNWDSYS